MKTYFLMKFDATYNFMRIDRRCLCQCAPVSIPEVPMTVAALKDWLNQWLEVFKTHHAQHLEKRHCRELNAFERQMRLKDERLESFRQQLLNMDTESSNMKSELEVLKSNMKSEMEELKSKLATAVEEKSRAERAVEGKDKELRSLMKIMLQNGEGSPAFDAVNLDKLSHYDAQQRVLIFLQKELNDARYVPGVLTSALP